MDITPDNGVWDVIHAVPVNDSVMHENTEECVCIPTVEPRPRADGSMGWLLITHHSAGGR